MFTSKYCQFSSATYTHVCWPGHLCAASGKPIRHPCPINRKDGRGIGEPTWRNDRVAWRYRGQRTGADYTGTDACGLPHVRPQPSFEIRSTDSGVSTRADLATDFPWTGCWGSGAGTFLVRARESRRSDSQATRQITLIGTEASRSGALAPTNLDGERD